MNYEHFHDQAERDAAEALDALGSPDAVARVLRFCAQRMYEASGDLESAWQDRNAGKPWRRIARHLERAAAAGEDA